MKHLLVLLASCGRSYNKYLEAQLTELKSAEVKAAVKGVVKEAVVAWNESGCMDLSERTSELQGKLKSAYRDLKSAVKEGYKEAMAELPAKKEEAEEGNVIDFSSKLQ